MSILHDIKGQQPLLIKKDKMLGQGHRNRGGRGGPGQPKFLIGVAWPPQILAKLFFEETTAETFQVVLQDRFKLY